MKRVIDVAAAIIWKDDLVFVARRGPNQKMAAFWEFPGGKIESSESPQQCIERELAEELSMSAVAGKVLLHSLHEYPDFTVNLIAVEVVLTDDEFELTVHDQWDWVSAESLLDLRLAPADIPIAKALVQRAQLVRG